MIGITGSSAARERGKKTPRQELALPPRCVLVPQGYGPKPIYQLRSAQKGSALKNVSAASFILEE